MDTQTPSRDEHPDEQSQAKQDELYDAFTELGSDAESSDVSFAFEAQAEVALRDRVDEVGE